MSKAYTLIAITLVIGIGYVIGVAPGRLVRGEAGSTKEAAIGTLGLAFWAAIAVGLVGLEP